MARKDRPQWLPIRTERLILREFRESDYDDIHAYGADPEVSRFMIWGPNTHKDTREFLGDIVRALRQYRPHTVFTHDPYRIHGFQHRDHRKAGVVTTRRPPTEKMSARVGSASTSASPGKMGAVRSLVRMDWGRRRGKKLPCSSNARAVNVAFAPACSTTSAG